MNREVAGNMCIDPSTMIIITLFKTTGDIAIPEPPSIQTSFEGRSLIFAPNIRQRKRFFCRFRSVFLIYRIAENIGGH